MLLDYYLTMPLSACSNLWANSFEVKMLFFGRLNTKKYWLKKNILLSRKMLFIFDMITVCFRPFGSDLRKFLTRPVVGSGVPV